MSIAQKNLHRWLTRRTRGATLVEGAVIIALIALVCVIGVKATGRRTASTLCKSSEAINKSIMDYDELPQVVDSAVDNWVICCRWDAAAHQWQQFCLNRQFESCNNEWQIMCTGFGVSSSSAQSSTSSASSSSRRGPGGG